MATATAEEIIRAAQNDDAMTQLVYKYNLFIIRSASASCRKFVTKHDDEYAIALRAFCDAVKSYDPDTAVSFEAYTKLVIKNRIIDYIRSESRHAGHLSLEDEMENGHDIADDADREQADVSSAAADEIARLSHIISAYGIVFSDLPDVSPKHQKTRSECAKAVRYMITHPTLVADMRRNHCLPMKILQESCDLPRKTLERHRKYIVTAIEACLGEYPVISEYLKHMTESDDQS